MLVKFLFTFAIALFLTYPAAILTTIIEGQSAAAIYSFHLPTSLFCYFLIALPTLLLVRRCHPELVSGSRRNPSASLGAGKFGMTILAGIIILYGFLVFRGLNNTDIAGDDYDLAYQAYNLQDGIQAARKANIISFNTHPPLFMTIKHYWFQVLFPHGLETIPAWGYRGIEGILGLATILAVYAITRSRVAALLLAVNNYMIFLGRVYLREMPLVFFLTLSLYFFQKRNYLITAFLIGCGLLIKTSAIIILPPYLLILFYRREFKSIIKILSIIFIIYLPVFLYNFMAFVTTGHMDATFSKIFGLAHPFLTGSAGPLENLKNIYLYLSDIYSLPVLIIFILATLINFRSSYFLLLVSSFLYFIFGGPLREYYLLFMTIPFVVMAAKLPKVMIVPVIIFSLWYSLFGNSAARKLYEPSRGWPQLVKEVKSAYQPGDCLEKSGGVNDLALRAYFQTDDAVKYALIGPDYPHYYKMCNEVLNPTNKINIFYNNGTAAHRL